jgi:dipeptidyl aminopeptidase/acylaminoacyl peptidase
MKNQIAFVALLVAGGVFNSTGTAQTKRLIRTEDCVTVKYLNDDGVYSPLQINRQGTSLAYVVKSPNLTENRNDIELYVKSLSRGYEDPAKLVLVANTISQILWAEDGKHVFVLANDGSDVTVSMVDVVAGARSVIARGNSDIKEYTVDAAGDTIVFATEDQSGVHRDKPTAKQIATGYRIPFQSQDQNRYIQRRLFITRRLVSGIWSKPKSIIVNSPLSGQELNSFSFTPSLRLSISPDGKKLAFTYLIGEQEQLPTEWSNSLIGSLVLNNGVRPMTVLLINLDTSEAKIPFKTAWAFSIPMWASDSQSFTIAATSPVGSVWEREDSSSHSDIVGANHLFWISSETGKVEEVAKHVASLTRGPLWWGADGDMLVQTEENIVTRLSHSGDAWHPTDTFRSPLDGISFFAHAVSDGSNIIGENEDSVTAPELVTYRLGESKVVTLAQLDPQFDNLILASVKRVDWKTSTGYKINGLLLVPPDYAEGRAYPLVIHTYHASEKFFCDYGEGHWPSFPPQPLADAGILYLIRTGGTGDSKEDIEHRPPGYPGGIGEAGLQLDIWDSAVRTFAARGWVDPNRVGIIGFSRSGWYTEFTLSQSKLPYAAATVTDNVTYSLGDYWLFHTKTDLQGDDAMYGGPPYGKTLKNWLDYAPTFNIDKIHTPILMEEMGYGVSYDNENTLPRSLMVHYELFTGLNRLNKPVELYYYPLEGHTPDHPQARLASLQRNVDWYRFWLQGYERPNPEDPDQYKRWEHLRELQDAEDNAAGAPATSPSEPN